MSKPDEVLRQCCQPKPDSKDSFLAVPTQEVRCAFKQPSKPTCPRKLACTRLKYGRVLRSDKASGKCRLLGLANCSGKASKTALSVPASCLQCEDTSSVGIVCSHLKGKARADVYIRESRVIEFVSSINSKAYAITIFLHSNEESYSNN